MVTGNMVVCVVHCRLLLDGDASAERAIKKLKQICCCASSTTVFHTSIFQ